MTVTPNLSEPVAIPQHPLDQDAKERIVALDSFRYALRQYLAFSDTLLAGLKLGPRRYQAMLAIKAREDSGPITIGTLSRLLLIRPNSATELVNRLERAGLVRRVDDPNDRRRQCVQLTDLGHQKVQEAAELHYAKVLDHRQAFANLFALEESQWKGHSQA